VSGHDEYVIRFDSLDAGAIDVVGGKNAALGEMIRALKREHIRVPGGFATTAHAYRTYIEHNAIEPELRRILEAYDAGERPLDEAGDAIRRLIRSGEFPDDVADAIRAAYAELGERYDRENLDVAVRSSATAEDLPEASFAGQLESFLNISGEAALLHACRECYASLFTDRAIAYREEQGFGQLDIALSVGVQKMVRSDLAGAGVAFTIDTESGFPDVVVIDAAWGLGEAVVQGSVNPDRYIVYKRSLDDDALDPIIGKALGSKREKIVYADDGGDDGAPTRRVETSEEERGSFVLDDSEIRRLATWCTAIEAHYDRPMDIEWAKDGEEARRGDDAGSAGEDADAGGLWIVQARPETVRSRETANTLTSYSLKQKGERLVTGVSVGQAIAAGRVQVIDSAADIGQFEEGGILVTSRTDPNWVPIMKRAAGIVTDHGGRTSHAAIVSRELGIGAVVGTGDATRVLEDGREVTISCAEGEEGYVYDGRLEFEREEIDLSDVPETDTRIMLNIAAPEAAMRWWRLPVRGVGLARMEYLINDVIRIHPLALTRFDELEDEDARAEIERLTGAHADREQYFVDHLARGMATIAASRYPDPVIVRMSDFKTNEYAGLIGGRQFEPEEENPMLGWRGASRYYSDEYRDGFALECRAIRHVRIAMGLDNVVVMIPFCRTPEEADRVLEVMAENGLERGADGLEVYVMAELPVNVIQAAEFAERFDGFSIGSNDLTQLVLGVGRDEARIAHLFDEAQPAVREMIAMLIERAHDAGRPVGFCGDAPSSRPEFAAFLVEQGIDSISVTPDSVLDVIRIVAATESERRAPA
jgi:pyruvate, water dikinase